MLKSISFHHFPPQYCTNNTMCLVCLVIEKKQYHRYEPPFFEWFTSHFHRWTPPGPFGNSVASMMLSFTSKPLGKEIQGLFAFAGHVLLWCWKANTWDHHETLKTKGKHNSITGWLYIYIYNIMWIIMRCHGIQTYIMGIIMCIYIYIYMCVCVHNLGGPSKPRSPLLNHNLNMIELHM